MRAKAVGPFKLGRMDMFQFLKLNEVNCMLALNCTFFKIYNFLLVLRCVYILAV